MATFKPPPCDIIQIPCWLLTHHLNEAKPAFIEAYTVSHMVMANIDLALEGKPDKTKAVTEYNRKLDPFFGEMNNLNAIKARLDTSL